MRHLFQEKRTKFSSLHFLPWFQKRVFPFLFFLAMAGVSCAADQALTSGVPFNTYLPGKNIAKNLFIDVPAGATKLTVAITNGSGDLDLYVKYGRRLQGSTVSQYDADTDFISDGPTPDEQIVVTPSSTPPLREGRWYIATLNWNSTTTHFTVTATVEMASTSSGPATSSQAENSARLSMNLFSNVKDLEANMYLLGLSPSQEAFVKGWGYPSSFVKIFGMENGHVRVDELWIYAEKGIEEKFINGILKGESPLEKPFKNAVSTRFKPEDYNFNTTIDDVINRHGQPKFIQTEHTRGTEVKIYIYQGLSFGFMDGKLASVMTNLETE